MRIYKFLKAQYALDAIEDKRLKLSEINSLNDPYEIDHFNLTDENHAEDLLLLA